MVRFKRIGKLVAVGGKLVTFFDSGCLPLKNVALSSLLRQEHRYLPWTEQKDS